MKTSFLAISLLTQLSYVFAHEAHKKGYHAQSSSFLPQVNPVLAGSVTMLVVGLAALALSYRKYRKDA